ncbi:putative GDP-L-fucose synthase 1 [Carex littledalei]|uniref:Putative GDP-L-fucose synthase 1 n=1 Tax=Carex littledalei TaxID=544730 RepID=A0A833VJW4_9POAL|nr:putative GDP-L-fucose synthase 1 [Carex littledalei]
MSPSLTAKHSSKPSPKLSSSPLLFATRRLRLPTPTVDGCDGGGDPPVLLIRHRLALHRPTLLRLRRSCLSDKLGNVFVAGHLGPVGSAVQRRLASLGFTDIVVNSRVELDLTHQAAVEVFFSSEQPCYYVIVADAMGQSRPY